MKYVLQTNLSCFKFEHESQIDNKKRWILVPGDVIEIGNTVEGLTEIYWKGIRLIAKSSDLHLAYRKIEEEVI